MKKIKANTPCLLSQIGHNNFWYPQDHELGMTYITEEIEEPDFKSWTCGNPNLKALVLSPTYLRDVYGHPDKEVVVWIRNKDLKS